MIKSVKITNYLGEELVMDLSRPERSGFIITSITGLGPADATINTTDIVTADGSRFNSSRLTNRNIVMNLKFKDSDRWSIEDVRQKSYKYFPIKKNLTFTITTDNRIAEIEGYVEKNKPDIFSKEEGCQISIICPYPYFISAENGGYQITRFSGTYPMFEFPFENNSLTEPLLEMGDIRIRAHNVIDYIGDSEVGMLIRMYALNEVHDLTIHSLRTNGTIFLDTEKLREYTGQGFVKNDEILISTVQGSKFAHLIRDGEEYNILNCLGTDIDWFKLSKGHNNFYYEAVSGGVSLNFTIYNQVLYEGV